jgi:hypothetical protein
MSDKVLGALHYFILLFSRVVGVFLQVQSVWVAE